MPRLNFVNRARKDNPAVKRGEPYYWWKFPFSPKQYSKTRPPRSALTQSEFLGWLWDFEDGLDGRIRGFGHEDLEACVSEIVEELNERGEELQERFDNMPEALQWSSSPGEILQERIDTLENIASELEGLDVDFPLSDMDDEEAVEDFLIENGVDSVEDWFEIKISEIQDCIVF